MRGAHGLSRSSARNNSRESGRLVTGQAGEGRVRGCNLWSADQVPDTLPSALHG